MTNNDLQDEDGYIPVSEVTPMEILNDLLSPENIEMKTDIKNPASWSSLKTLARYLEGIGFDESAQLIYDYMTDFMVFAVSKARLSRGEIISAIKSDPQSDFTVREKMLMDLKDK